MPLLRRVRSLHLLGAPGCQCLFSLRRVTVYICIGRSPGYSLRIYGSATPKGFIAFAITTDWWLTPLVRLTLLRCYDHLGHTTVSAEDCAKFGAQSCVDPTPSNNSKG